MRSRAALVFALALAGATSCGEKRKPSEGEPEPKQPAAEVFEAPSEAPAKDGEPEKKKVGIGDFVEYATGKKLLDIKKRTERKLRDMEAEQERRYQEALDGE